jgi:hypothetical protein
VLDDVVVVLVLAVGKREDSAAYTEAIKRVISGAREAVVKALRLGKSKSIRPAVQVTTIKKNSKKSL